MAVNKVIFGGETVIDLTGDTVTPETLAEGVTAHDKSGRAITGTMPVPADYIVEEGTADIWTWRKWASGIAECWGIQHYLNSNGVKFTAWGTCYEAGGGGFAPPEYPFAFIEKPVCTGEFTIPASWGGWLAVDTTNQATHNWLTTATPYAVIRPNNSANGVLKEVSIMYRAIGKWK